MSNTPTPSADMQKLLNDCEEARNGILAGEDEGNTPRIIVEGKFLAKAMPSLLHYIHSLEQDHKAMREALERIAHDDRVFIREGEKGISASISNAMNQGHRLARDSAQSALSSLQVQ